MGHKALFDLFLGLQQLGARVFIPLTNDESLVDGKVDSLAKSLYLSLRNDSLFCVGTKDEIEVNIKYFEPLGEKHQLKRKNNKQNFDDFILNTK